MAEEEIRKERRKNIKSNDRVFVLGQTGSGKSYFAQNMLYPAFKRIVAHDYKWEMNVQGRITHNPLDIMKHSRIIYRPVDGSIEDFDMLCKTIFQIGNIMLYVDECAPFSGANMIPIWYGNLMRMGRSRNCGVINLSQRPMAISNVLLSEAHHFFVFRLQLEGDRRKIAGIIGEEIMVANTLPKYCFLSYSQEEGIVRKNNPIK